MSLTFINNINNESKYSYIELECEKIWKKSPETSIKLFFFILDKEYGKNQPKAFHKIMTWLYLNHTDTFYKNYSLIVGKYNSKTMPPKQAQQMLNKEYKKHNQILNEFISPEYQKSFKIFWESSANHSLFNSYNLPKYGEWNDLIKIYTSINKTSKKNKLYYTTINLFSNQIKEDIKNKVYSEALHSMIGTIIEEGVNEIIAKSYQEKIISIKKEIPTKSKVNHLTFVERYAFIIP